MSISEQWQEFALQIGREVYSAVNTREMVGTDEETGYVLMFFNVKNHDGKSTLVSSNTGRDDLRKLLKEALRSLDKARVIEPTKYEQ